jgi:hypothetical protein
MVVKCGVFENKVLRKISDPKKDEGNEQFGVDITRNYVVYTGVRILKSRK